MSDKNNLFQSVTYGFRIENDQDQWEYSEEPHVTRRQEILSKYPQIKSLMGPDKKLIYLSLIEVCFQFTMAYLIWFYDPGWFTWCAITYFIGGTVNHSLGCAIHEIAHNLAFGHKYGKCNRILSIICNLPMGIPMAISYRKYHLDHHKWLGNEQADTDLPLECEAKLCVNPLSRFIWICLHPLFYAFRPFIKQPRPINVWEIINLFVQLTFDVLVWYFLGNKLIGYFITSTLLGLSIHPFTGHFISEHYLFGDKQATHSYYGICNYFLFNVGYHMEHHDFPYIAFSNLPKIKKIAPEYYDNIPYHTSLCKVMWDFVFYKNNGPQAHCITSTDLCKPYLYEPGSNSCNGDVPASTHPTDTTTESEKDK